MTAAVALRFRIGARTLGGIARRLRRVSLSLDEALAGAAPALPLLDGNEDGYLVTSLPEAALPLLPRAGLIGQVRQYYHRHFVDLSMGEAAWRAGLSANARAQIGRKAKRLGAHRIERFRTPDEIAAFHARARPLSARTYQERLMDDGLPADPAPLLRLAAADRVRAWLLSIGEEAVAYLCCTGDGVTLRYDHVGHDPTRNALSPGAVLQAAALRDLFTEGRWGKFDFTQGEGQHKRQFATGSVACVDLLLLRPTLGNRAVLAALVGWERAVTLGKRWAPALRRLGR